MNERISEAASSFREQVAAGNVEVKHLGLPPDTDRYHLAQYEIETNRRWVVNEHLKMLPAENTSDYPGVSVNAAVWLGEKGLGGAIGGRGPYLKPAVLDLGAPDGDGDEISQEGTTAAHATVHAPEPPKPAASRKPQTGSKPVSALKPTPVARVKKPLPEVIEERRSPPKLADTTLLRDRDEFAQRNEKRAIRAIRKQVQKLGFEGNEWGIPSSEEEQARYAEAVVEDFFKEFPGLISEALKRPALRMRPQSMDAVLSSGRFKSTFELGYEGMGHTSRNKAEARMGVEFRTLDRDRPIYGYSYDAASPAPEGSDLSFYGKLIAHLKDTTVERSTVTFGDSFNGTFGVPWARMKEGDISREEALALVAETWLLELIGRYYDKVGWPSFSSPGDDPRDRALRSFVELQVHGGLSLEDVERFEFLPDSAADDWLAEYRDILDGLGIAHNIPPKEPKMFTAEERQQMAWEDIPEAEEVIKQMLPYWDGKTSGFDREKLRQSLSKWPDNDFVLDQLAKMRGYTELPRVLDKEEIDRLIREEGWIEMFRGVGAEGAQMFKYGEYATGMHGAVGNGFYASSSREVAEGYSRRGRGEVMRIAIPPEAIELVPSPPSAKLPIMDQESPRHRLPERFHADLNTLARGQSFSSVWSVAMGYDYATAPGTDYGPNSAITQTIFLLLNRSIVAVEA